MRDYIIVVAGGKGLRMGSDIPKQFLPIGGKPVLMRTWERFREYSDDLQIILVLPEAQQEYWQGLCEKYDFKVEYMLANGGQTRFHSVTSKFLTTIRTDVPLDVSFDDFLRKEPDAEKLRAVCTKFELNALARRFLGEDALPSEKPAFKTLADVPHDYRLVQTPQTFDIQLLKAANHQPYNDGFTDDASVVESYGHKITLVEGNRENIKITTPYDITVAEAIINIKS